MNDVRKLWGIHNDEFGAELIDQGFVSIGWDAIGDLCLIGNDQVLMRERVGLHYANAKPGAIAGWAGTLRRFAFEAQVGDLVVFPNKQDSTLNFGRITGDYVFLPGVPHHRHRRTVQWLKVGAARNLFTQGALYEVGSALTMFRVKRHVDEFLCFLDAVTEDQFVQAQPRVEQQETEEQVEDSVVEMMSADRIDQHTRDFIGGALLTELTHEEFEHFTADLLRCMGYQARVTHYGGDGGVDVIAHKDLLGLEPPIIKVQCKHTVATQGRPVVQQLIGTLATNEAGLFFTLGNYSGDALAVERERQNLRLHSGADIVDLTLRHYDHLPAKWRAKIPLRQVLAVDV